MKPNLPVRYVETLIRASATPFTIASSPLRELCVASGGYALGANVYPNLSVTVEVPVGTSMERARIAILSLCMAIDLADSGISWRKGKPRFHVFIFPLKCKERHWQLILSADEHLRSFIKRCAASLLATLLPSSRLIEVCIGDAYAIRLLMARLHEPEHRKRMVSYPQR